MGRHPEDGQAVLFESTTDVALDLFAELEFDTWICRLARVCADVHAIYTPDVGRSLLEAAQIISERLGTAYYSVNSDEPVLCVWKDGKVWISDIPQGREGRRRLRQIEASVFVDSNAAMNGGLWKTIEDFLWENFDPEEFLLEK